MSESANAEPEHPDDGVRTEVHQYLLQDPTRLGDVYRLRQEGVSDDEEVGRRLGVNTSRFGWNADYQAKALLDGHLLNAPSTARSVVGRANSALRSEFPFTPAARQWLESVRDRADAIAASSANVAAGDRRLAGRTDEIEAANVPGIYVYTLPHYLDYPKYPDTGATLMKVGHSTNDAIVRFRGQTRTTALPEEPVLLRVYTIPNGRDSHTVEGQLHSTLRNAPGAEYAPKRSAGVEWFPATLEFLDSMATLAGLTVHFEYESDDTRHGK